MNCFEKPFKTLFSLLCIFFFSPLRSSEALQLSNFSKLSSRENLVVTSAYARESSVSTLGRGVCYSVAPRLRKFGSTHSRYLVRKLVWDEGKDMR